MAIGFPNINPVRATKQGRIDYDDYFPRPDLMTTGINYQQGIIAAKYYCDFKVTGKLQVMVSSSDSSISGQIFEVTESGNVLYTNYFRYNETPAGWVHDNLYRFSNSINKEGVFYFVLTAGSETYTSDYIYVHDPADSMDLVDFNYYDSFNRLCDNSAVFFDSAGSTAWSPTVYYEGISRNKTYSEQTDSEDDSGGFDVTRAVIQKGLIVTLVNIHETYLTNIYLQTACDNLIINGINYNRVSISEELVEEKTDIYNVTIELKEKNATKTMQTS